MSIIAAGTTTTTALSSTGNTDGTLQLQVNGTTPSVTLNTLGAIGVGSSPSYGTSGQVLTSGGSTVAPAWTTPATTSPAGSTGQIQYNNAGVFGAVGSGTSTTVLHGNASGAPTYSAVSLTADVTGTLPVINGGTGQTTYTNGQLLIGNTSGNTLTKSTLTAGSGISITNGGGSITIAASGGSSGLTKISTGSISGQTTVTSGISSTYRYYKLLILGLYDSTGSGAFRTDLNFYAGGSIDTNSTYRNQSQYLSSGTTAQFYYGAGDSSIKLSTTAGGNNNGQTNINIEFAYDSSYYSCNGSFASGNLNGNTNYAYGLIGYNGVLGANAPVTGFVINPVGNPNVSNGTWILYGYN
jgi:hypothetical protein